MGQQRHESTELGNAARRMMRALVRRAAEGDEQALSTLYHLQADATDATTAAGRLMHSGSRFADGEGYSFTFLANELGITRQAARQRFGKPLSSASAAYWMAGR